MLQITKSKLSIDVLLNFIALAFVGASGIVFNFLVVLFYDAKALGTVNQVFALFLIFAQIGTWGLQFSAQKHIASAQSEQSKKEHIIVTIFVTTMISFVVSILFFSLSRTIANIQHSSELVIAIRMASVGLFFFSLNKVLLGCFNGLRQMKVFGVLQLLRSLLILMSFVVLYLINIAPSYLSLVFTIAELLVFVTAVTLFLKNNLLDLSLISIHAIKEHLQFGFKSLFSGFLIELNTRVDVLMIGFFLSSKEVGVYTLALTVAEGLSLILIVLRNNFNPIMAEMYSRNAICELQSFITKGKIKTYQYFSAFSLIAAIGFISFAYLTLNPDLIASITSFIILVLGIVVGSGCFPFLALLMQAGYPGVFSSMIALSAIINFVLNLILTPWLGILGAAISTAIANIINTYSTCILTKNRTSIKII